MSKAPILTAELLRSLLHYNPRTGVFTWLRRAKSRCGFNALYAEKRAGYEWTPKGSRVTYRVIRIFDWPFLEHRLAWLYMTSQWPENLVDHEDCDGLNNKWLNLRAADRSKNAANSKISSRNTSGFKGASFCKSAGKWRATITVDGRQKWLGYHDTVEEAHEAYRKAASEKSGEFARFE